MAGGSGLFRPDQPIHLTLGARHYDLTERALVMGIVNRTPDSFYDKGRYFDLQRSIDLAHELVEAGADLIDIGGVKAGPGVEVTPSEEIDRVLPAIEALAGELPVPISVDTWRAEVAALAYRAGAVLGNDISGFGDPDYLEAAAAAGASVVATHIRLAPRVRDPEPTYPANDVVGAVESFLRERLARATSAGLTPDRVVLDAGLDLGKTAIQSLKLLRASSRLAAIGPALLLSASNKTFLGVLLDLEIDQRRDASLAAAAIGISGGCRILRVHDVAGTRRVADTLAAVVTR